MDDQRIIDKLRESTNNLRKTNQINKRFFIHVGTEWLSLPKNNPEMLGSIPMNLAIDVASYYSRMNILIGRINWMVRESFEQDRFEEVCERQERTEKELRGLREERNYLEGSLAKTAKLVS